MAICLHKIQHKKPYKLIVKVYEHFYSVL